MRLEGQVVLITGVSHAGQVGYALAAAFAHEGAHLAISARTAERVNARAQELRARGASVIAIPADLTTEEGANTLIQKTLAAYGRIDVLVNLAGGLTTYSPPRRTDVDRVGGGAEQQPALCFPVYPCRLANYEAPGGWQDSQF